MNRRGEASWGAVLAIFAALLILGILAVVLRTRETL
jgi:hypothetical protein